MRKIPTSGLDVYPDYNRNDLSRHLLHSFSNYLEILE